MGRLKTLGARIRTQSFFRTQGISQEPNWGKGRGGRPWRRLREQVLQRDCYTCQHCGRVCLSENLCADHIINRARGGTDNLANLQTLCNECHTFKTANESKGGGVESSASKVGGHRMPSHV